MSTHTFRKLTTLFTDGENFYFEIEFVVSGMHSYMRYYPSKPTFVNGFHGHKLIPRPDLDNLKEKPFWTKKPMFEIENFFKGD